MLGILKVFRGRANLFRYVYQMTIHSYQLSQICNKSVLIYNQLTPSESRSLQQLLVILGTLILVVFVLLPFTQLHLNRIDAMGRSSFVRRAINQLHGRFCVMEWQTVNPMVKTRLSVVSFVNFPYSSVAFISERNFRLFPRNVNQSCNNISTTIFWYVGEVSGGLLAKA